MIIAQEFLSLSQNPKWSYEIGEKIITLWENVDIKEIYSLVAELYKLNETVEYFFDNCKRLMEDNYIPTIDDIMRARVKTIGIDVAKFSFDGKIFQVVDVGGQKSERRKWIHCFSNVTAILFVASLSDFNMKGKVLSLNRMKETLIYFEEITISPNFENIPIILFLNKLDLFKVKLSKGIGIIECFPNYEGDTDFDKSLLFIKCRFLELAPPEKKNICSLYYCYEHRKY